MRKTAKLLALLMAVCMILSSCADSADKVTNAVGGSTSGNILSGAGNVTSVINGGNKNEQNGVPEKGTFNEGVVLVKYDGEMDESVLSQLAVSSADPLYKGSKWYLLTLADGEDTVKTVEYLRELDCFDAVDYDYIMGTTADASSADVSGNPDKNKQPNLGLHNIPNGWTQNGKHPGGSPDIIVAVIDTGVDYNHLDLRNNIWVNSAEIPNNGIDDDKNGYVDDVYGWDCVGDDNDPMDDNGHGTHVAGIIAAENNKIGGVGVAYGCKVMVLKAGNSSGYFNNSDIAEAIQYAYMNGASVINMSFGGSNISIAAEEALENAYNTSVLVAAAGNDGLCNHRGCPDHDDAMAMYPAALPYVIGVMSTGANGEKTSYFSNYDHYPYNNVEYEVYAVGEAVNSTWPGNKYATLNGTSMAAPTVSGIAALLRSMYPDRNTYSTKYLQSQIVNTGTVCFDGAHSVADVYEAMTRIPEPEVNLYDYYINDSADISAGNNGNGVIDAGETVRLSVALHNRGGVAVNVNVSVDTLRSGGNTDPYFTIVNSTIALSDIGTYSVRESGDEKYFEIIVSPDCPNDYLVDFNISFTYENGMNESDKTVYSGEGKAQFRVSSGFYLPMNINKNTVYKADRLYIVGSDVVIPEGVTVTFEEGCEIQFYDDNDYYNSPRIRVYGTLNLSGSKTNMVSVKPSEARQDMLCFVKLYTYGIFNADYVNFENIYFEYDIIKYGVENPGASTVSNCSIKYKGDQYDRTSWFLRGTKEKLAPNLSVDNLLYSSIEFSVGSDQNYTPSVLSIIRPDRLVKYNAIGNFIYTNNGTIDLSGPYDNNDCENVFENNIVYVKEDVELSRFRVDPYTDPIGKINNNRFNAIDDNSLASVGILSFPGNPKENALNNAFSPLYQKYASQIIKNYYDASGNPTVDVYGSLADASLLWPHVVGVEILDKDGEPVTKVGVEEIKVRVTFSRPMDKNAGTFVTFGTAAPYADYRIDGEFVSDTVWEGTYTLKAQIENGQNYLKVNDAWAADDSTKKVFGDYQLHEFTIDTTAAMSMTLIANPTEKGIELTWAQDDYDTLLGYNIYRSDEKDGNFVKLNPTVLLPTDERFVDENAEPGKTYWYTYTVVLSDFSESNPAGKVQATSRDTIVPSVYHTPVNQGYLNNNLVISCTASDNIAIASVVLYYRTVGAAEWKNIYMAKQNDKYSATVFGSELTLDGIEYYIVAYDTFNSIEKGSAEAPYTVIVKDASSISRKGDVDGDGSVTAKDALMIIQTINEDRILTDDEFIRADLNGDGKLSSSEALRILQYVNGNVNTLEM